MKYKIDTSSRPVYLQIYKLIRNDIINEVYPYKTKLPSKRLLADETKVSTVTVEHAYALLCDEGYVEPRERSGYFVIFRNSDGFALSAESVIPPAEPPHSRQRSPGFPFSVLAQLLPLQWSKSSAFWALFTITASSLRQEGILECRKLMR